MTSQRPALPKPVRGDVFSARLDPTEGSEQAGTRPVVIISRDSINANSPVVVVVPVGSVVVVVEEEVVVVLGGLVVVVRGGRVVVVRGGLVVVVRGGFVVVAPCADTASDWLDGAAETVMMTTGLSAGGSTLLVAVTRNANVRAAVGVPDSTPALLRVSPVGATPTRLNVGRGLPFAA